MIKLGIDFYRADGLTLAEKLLGKVLVHRTDSGYMRGIITETEAYMGVTDRASHAYGGRRTDRTETMYMPGGHAYVYLIYGMYNCMNITANAADIPEAVLIRAVYPIDGEELFYENYKRRVRRKNFPSDVRSMSERELYAISNGPGKLCVSMDIDRRLNGVDMTSDDFFVADGGAIPKRILRSPRIGIDYAGEDKDRPWRFTVSARSGVPEFM